MEARRSSRVFGLVIAVIVLAAVALALAAPDRGRSPVAFPGTSAFAPGTTEPMATAAIAATPDPTATAPEASEPDEQVKEPPARPLLMPALISGRPAMAFCGHDSVARTVAGDIGDPETWECLVAALEAGGAGELIRDMSTIEGAPTRSIVRTRPSGEIEWWYDATRDPFGSQEWSRRVCGRLETFEPDPGAAPVYLPEDCGAPEVLIGPDQQDQPSGDEMAMLEALVLFARTGDERFLSAVPLSDDGVWLGLADQLIVHLPPEDLVRPGAWRLAADAFRGFVGPFSALDQLAAWGPDSARGFVREASVTVGPHPHCASPPVPAPAEVAELRRLSVQPVGELACPAWWTVDLFVEPGGAIAAITLDRYEP